MSAATKRKHVVKEMLENFDMPEHNQTIVKVLGTKGSNLHEIITPGGQRFLASLPVKFRKNIWIKRGDYVIIEPIEEGDKVKAEIVRILYPQHIKEIKQMGIWPNQFDVGRKPTEMSNHTGSDDQSFKYCNDAHDNGASSTGEDSEDDFSDIPINTNRPPQEMLSDSDELSTESENDD